MGEHLLGVVARGLGLDDGRRPARVEPGEQHRRFDLRRGDGRAVEDRRDGVGPAQGDRAAPALGLGDHLAPHLPQRIEDAPHRPLAQRASPSKVASIGWLPTTPIISRAPVPALPKSSVARGLRAARRGPAPRTRPAPGRVTHDLRAELAAGLAGAQHVLAFEQARGSRGRRGSAGRTGRRGARSTCRPAAARGPTAARIDGR